ncbi:MAG: 6-phosphogluconolactonase, partial [Desulfocapsa sp.]
MSDIQITSHFHSFSTQNALVEELAEVIATLLSRGITENGRASLAVSGGSTPIPLFKKLSTLSIPWEQVHISLVDERWVAVDDNDSNEKLVR